MKNNSLNKQISKFKQDLNDNMSSIEDIIEYNISEAEWQYFYFDIVDECFCGEESSKYCEKVQDACLKYISGLFPQPLNDKDFTINFS